VTHNESLALRCDRIVRMKDGRIVDQNNQDAENNA
jgi:predicted ABC-type transport system involved in lysophospholipase L1 biosynthesis ATPase subunit